MPRLIDFLLSTYLEQQLTSKYGPLPSQDIQLALDIS
jgi:hypothetical protein